MGEQPYDVVDMKKKIPILVYVADQGYKDKIKGNRFPAFWRDGKNNSCDANFHDGIWQYLDQKTKEGGSIVDLCMRAENLSLKQAIDALGERYGARFGIARLETHSRTGAAPRKCRADYLAADGFTCTASYPYTDGNGTTLYTVERWEKPGAKKEFLHRSASGENAKNVPRLLYRLEELRAADEVFLVEGEKDVETLRKLGFTATTNSGGGTFWKDEFNAEFSGKHVVIIADRDETGLKRAKNLLEALKPVAASVRSLIVSNIPHGDVTDYLEREGGTKEKLLDLIANAQETIPVFADKIATAKMLNCEPLQNWDGKDEKHATARRIADVSDDIRARLLGFPYVIGDRLFDDDRYTREIKYFDTHDALHAWIDRKTNMQSHFMSGRTFANWPTVFADLKNYSRKYDAIAEAPWFPSRANVYPHWPELPPPTDDCAAFWNFLDFFNPATPEDSILIAAFFLAPMFYMEQADRPAWIIDTVDGQGSGKTSLAATCAQIYNEEYINVDMKQLKDDATDVVKRILSSEGRRRRIVLLDNVTVTLKSDKLAELITQRTFSGRPAYGRGEVSAPNDKTWVVTINGAETDTDMAVRSYVIKIKSPGEKRDPLWAENIANYLSANRLQMWADMIKLMSSVQILRQRKNSRFARFDATVLSAVCKTDAEFEAVGNLINERGKDSNSDYLKIEALLQYIQKRVFECAENGLREADCYHLVISANDLDVLLERSSGPLKFVRSRNVRRWVNAGDIPWITKGMERFKDNKSQVSRTGYLINLKGERAPQLGDHVVAQMVDYSGYVLRFGDPFSFNVWKTK